MVRNIYDSGVQSPIPLPTPRAFLRSVVLWIFGLCTTLLLVGMWGRSVAADQTTLDESARAVLESELVNRRLDDWLTSAVAELGTMGPVQASDVVDSVLTSPELDGAVDQVVDATVEAALAPPDRVSRLELAPAVDQLEPAIDRALRSAGLPIDSEAVTSELADLTLSSRDLALASRTVGATRVFLSQVVLIAATGLALTGAIAVYLAENRMDQLRSLCWRISLSGFTFAIFLRLGAWAVDPAGGRSPVAAGGAVILGSNIHVPLLVALTAVIAGGIAVLLRKKKRTIPIEPDINPETTGEQPVLAGV